MWTHWATLQSHSYPLRTAAFAFSQMSPILRRSFLITPFQFVPGRPGPPLISGTSQYRACCGIARWRFIHVRRLNQCCLRSARVFCLLRWAWWWETWLHWCLVRTADADKDKIVLSCTRLRCEIGISYRSVVKAETEQCWRLGYAALYGDGNGWSETKRTTRALFAITRTVWLTADRLIDWLTGWVRRKDWNEWIRRAN